MTAEVVCIARGGVGRVPVTAEVVCIAGGGESSRPLCGSHLAGTPSPPAAFTHRHVECPLRVAPSPAPPPSLTDMWNAPCVLDMFGYEKRENFFTSSSTPTSTTFRRVFDGGKGELRGRRRSLAVEGDCAAQWTSHHLPPIAVQWVDMSCSAVRGQGLPRLPTLNVSDSSRNRRFSVGTKPARKMLMPSLRIRACI